MASILNVLKLVATIIAGIPALVDISKKIFVALNDYVIKLTTRKKKKEIENAFQKTQDSDDSSHIENLLK